MAPSGNTAPSGNIPAPSGNIRHLAEIFAPKVNVNIPPTISTPIKVCQFLKIGSKKLKDTFSVQNPIKKKYNSNLPQDTNNLPQNTNNLPQNTNNNLPKILE